MSRILVHLSIYPLSDQTDSLTNPRLVMEGGAKSHRRIKVDLIFYLITPRKNAIPASKTRISTPTDGKDENLTSQPLDFSPTAPFLGIHLHQLFNARHNFPNLIKPQQPPPLENSPSVRAQTASLPLHQVPHKNFSTTPSLMQNTTKKRDLLKIIKRPCFSCSNQSTTHFLGLAPTPAPTKFVG